jgi:DNA-binding transcriptional ArsR family regulator
MPKPRTSTFDKVYVALSDPTRRAVLTKLLEGPSTCSDLGRPFSMALPSFMQHIDMLEDAGLISSYKTGRVRICKLTTGNLNPAEEWISKLRAAAARMKPTKAPKAAKAKKTTKNKTARKKKK